MQSFDAIQFAAVQRSRAYLSKKAYMAQVKRENQFDRIKTLILLVSVAVLFAGIVVAVLDL
jgi:hypothetical protein